jgi:hypothetical protein
MYRGNGSLPQTGLLRGSGAFIAATSQFFLNLSMVASKAIMDATHGVEGSSIVTAIARNGVTTAIRVSGLGGRWFEAPWDTPVGLFFPGFSQEDANADLGDSAICETAGYGGQSLAASPALVQLVGGSVAQAVEYSREMYHVTWTRNPVMSLPNLEFAAAPAGIEVRKVVDTGIRPVVTRRRSCHGQRTLCASSWAERAKPEGGSEARPWAMASLASLISLKRVTSASDRCDQAHAVHQTNRS